MIEVAPYGFYKRIYRESPRLLLGCNARQFSMLVQTVRLQEGFAAIVALYSFATIVTQVPRQGTLFRIRGTASGAREGFRSLRVVVLGIRIPVTALLQMGVKKALKGEALVAIFAGIHSDDGRAEFYNTTINTVRR